MHCPNCKEKAMKLSQFFLFNPFKPFSCRTCNAILKTGMSVKILCVFTFCALAVSFYFTFPVMYDFIHSQSNSLLEFLLDMLLPLLAIILQVVIIFIPVSLYTWKWGKPVVISLNNQNPSSPAGPI